MERLTDNFLIYEATQLFRCGAFGDHALPVRLGFQYKVGTARRSGPLRNDREISFLKFEEVNKN